MRPLQKLPGLGLLFAVVVAISGPAHTSPGSLSDKTDGGEAQPDFNRGASGTEAEAGGSLVPMSQRWSLETGFSAGGDQLGAVTLIRRSDQVQLAREALAAGDSLRLGAAWWLPLSLDWKLQFAAGYAWGGIGIGRSLDAVQSLTRTYLRSEAIHDIERWRLGLGFFVHTNLKYRAKRLLPISMDAEPGLHFYAGYRLSDMLRLGVALETAEYSAGGTDFDADALVVQLAFTFF